MGKLDRLRQRGSSITGRLILGVVIVQLVLTPVLFYGILLIVERSFESQFVDQVRNNTFLYGDLLRPIVEQGSGAQREAFLDDAKISGDVVFAEFEGVDGSLDVPQLDSNASTLAFREDFAFGEHQDDVYFIATQLFSTRDGQPLGWLRLGYDEISVQGQIDTAYRFGSFIAAGYILFSTILAVYFGRRMFQPVSALRRFARSIAAGDEHAHLQVDTNIAELQHLANDLRQMHASLMAHQQEILDRELRLEALLNHAGEGIITIDESGDVQSFNMAAERIFGYEAAEIIGQSVTRLAPPPHDELSSAQLRKLLASDSRDFLGVGRRLQARRKDGELIPVYLTVSKVQLQDEISYTGILHDLSAEEQKDAELQQLSRAVEQSPVSILITNTAGNIEYVNPSFCQLTGYSAEEVIGENPRFLNSGQTSSEDYRQLWSTIANGGTWRGIFRNKTRSGDLVWLSSTVCPVHDQLGQITHYISISENITDARKKESMLTQAMKLEAIGRLTDGISHDFNNLLTIIQGNLKFLMDDLPSDDEEHIELIEDALSAAQDGSDLIRRLLAFSRRQEMDVRLTNINKTLSAMERILQRAVPELTISLDLEDPVGNALVDSNRLESAILNLVTNARDAMPDGGSIVIATRQHLVDETRAGETLAPGRYIALSVTDTGVGMDAETREQAVEPFFTTKPIEAGTGLGLTMVHDFVRQCGGELVIDSSPGEGTTIRMLLPSSSGAEQEKTPTYSKDALPTGNETILVVEDREGVRRFACRILQRLGYRTLEAADAAAARSCLVAHEDIDLLFSDIVMPGDTDGRELAIAAVADRPGLRVLLTTGMEPTREGETLREERFELLSKPYTDEQLALAVRAILDA